MTGNLCTSGQWLVIILSTDDKRMITRILYLIRMQSFSWAS
jgi:hypothetical protein